MFQDFDTVSDPSCAAPRIKALREVMAKSEVDAYLVPRADEYQGEYVPPSSERLNWLTGFSGSAGVAVIARKTAALFVDGRYTVQVRAEVDVSLYELPKWKNDAPVQWMKENLQTGAVVGFDPRLHTISSVRKLTTELKKNGIKLKPVARNLVDRIWAGARPPEPSGLVTIQPLKFAGAKPADKLNSIREDLAKDGHDAVVLTQPDSICWLFNIRGSDIAHNPVVLCTAIVPRRGKPEIFIAPGKLESEVREHLKATARLRSPKDLRQALRSLRDTNQKIRLDPHQASWWFHRTLGPSASVDGKDPCILPKAKKNTAEIRGSRAAHLRDGTAMVRFLAWLDRTATKGNVDEITAARQLEAFRTETGSLCEISFDTISGSGPNGAIVHYRVNTATNRKLKPGELYLVDSGAQYPDGTTDITRTVAIGKPTAQMKHHNTLVLKGHIAIATARFPVGTRGVDLDPFARRPLWHAGLDYDHGTGHGVGSYLSVHEGPASISRAGMIPLEPGMILSNEPGYYLENAYGIRIENLVLVQKPEIPTGGERKMLSFETLTLAPIDTRLIDKRLLEANEREWLNAYHAVVLEKVGPTLADQQDRSWLKKACAPL